MRRTARHALLAICFFVSACGGAQDRANPAPATPPPMIPASPTSAAAGTIAAEKIASDSPRSTARGATFTAPGSWMLKSEGSHRVLDGPEPDLQVSIIDAEGSTADAAVASAWTGLHPDFKRPLKIAQDRPARYGWESRRQYIYETSPNERLVVYATALRKGDTWTVTLVESSEAAFERRRAHVRLIEDSLRPKGYERETFKGKTAHALDDNRIAELVQLVEQAREQAGIPGVAISLVQGDRTVLQRGFGVRELGKATPVDADTLFIIASNTKGLSTLLLAKLIDEGKFNWDWPVTKVYPAFKLGDADTTSKVLMKHLVCACTGLPRQDYEWLMEFKNATARAEMDLLGTMQPTTKFGEIFQYSNVMAAAAGFIGGYVAYPKRELGAAYDEAMRTRVFEPLGMKSTTFDFARSLGQNHAFGHAEDVDGKPRLATMDANRAVIPLRPAAGAWSSVRDLTRYVQMELANGKLPNGKQYISMEALLARRVPQVSVAEDDVYGMGLEVDSKYGTPVVHHGGSMFGFKSDMFWLPEHGVGGVVMTNADSGQLLLRPFVRRVLEVLFDGQPEASEDLVSAAKRRKELIAKKRERLVVPPDPTVLATLAKRYTSQALGEIAVVTSGKSTVFDFGEWKSTVASRKNDDGTTSIITVDPSVDGFEFVVSDHEGKRALVLRDMQHEYVFREK